MELRNIAGEVRAASESGVITGVALRYGSRSVDMGGWSEEFAPGAFDESLRTDDVRVIWQHDSRYVFGRVAADTARVWSDDVALRYEATPPDATWARDAVESIRRGDVDQNSFGFVALDDEVVLRDGSPVRIVYRARLVEVGPQTHPAYADTVVSVRSALPARTLQALEARGLGVDVAARMLRLRTSHR